MIAWALANRRLLAYMVLAAGLFAAGWLVNGWRWESKYQERELFLQQEAAKRYAALQADFTEADDRHAAQLEKARHENDSLRADVATGRKRLLVNATCPESGTTAAVGSAPQTACELTPDARQAYYDLRAGIIAEQSQLRELQSICQ